MGYSKVAMIRESGYPVGTSAPLFLKCLCGKKNKTSIDTKENVICECGQEFTYDGWLLNKQEVTK